MLNNPYNLTEIEKERLKEKNHLLISQFQNGAYRQYPYFLGSQYGAGSNRADNDSMHMSASLRFGQQAGLDSNTGSPNQRRSSIESNGTLYNNTKRSGVATIVGHTQNQSSIRQ